MIGMINSGGAGTINCLFGEDKKAEILASDGLSDNPSDMLGDFHLQTSLNHRVKETRLGHISLSFHPDDASKLSNEIMATIATEYLEEMDYASTQFVVVRHNDTRHPHCHLLFNRVDNNGKLLKKDHDFFKNKKATKKLREKHGLTYSERKTEKINVENLKGDEKIRHKICKVAFVCRDKSKDMDDLMVILEDHGVDMTYKWKNGSADVIEGVRFSMDGYTFPGSKIDRQLSYGNLLKHFAKQEQQQETELRQNP